jgi:hypothetical protein
MLTVTYSPFMLWIILLNVIMLNVIMLSAVMLSVMIKVVCGTQARKQFKLDMGNRYQNNDSKMFISRMLNTNPEYVFKKFLSIIF